MPSSVTCLEHYVNGKHMLDLSCRPHRPKTKIYGKYMSLSLLTVFMM